MFEEVEIVSGSMALHERRLFARFDLRQYLQHRHDLAVRQFVRGAQERDPDLLVERTLERFECAPLRLSDEIKLKASWNWSDGNTESQFAVRFSGDPILWDCSPEPIDDVLPEGCGFTHWYLPPGETLERPYGEVFRGELLKMTTGGGADIDLAAFSALIERQTVLIEQSDTALAEHLQMLAERYPTFE